MKRYRERVFPVLAGGLWAVFLFLDLTRLADSTGIKFASICLCCITALLGAHTVDGALVAAALCFTVGADWLLLVRNDHYLWGLGLFIVVQAIYALRLYLLHDKLIPPSVLLFRLAGAVTALSLAVKGQWINAFAAFYFFSLLINSYEASGGKGPVESLRSAANSLPCRFALGLVLFVCCDVCVGLWNMGLLPGFSRVGMWLFYLPSQVLIVLSQALEKGDMDEKAV